MEPTGSLPSSAALVISGQTESSQSLGGQGFLLPLFDDQGHSAGLAAPILINLTELQARPTHQDLPTRRTGSLGPRLGIQKAQKPARGAQHSPFLPQTPSSPTPAPPPGAQSTSPPSLRSHSGCTSSLAPLPAAALQPFPQWNIAAPCGPSAAPALPHGADPCGWEEGQGLVLPNPTVGERRDHLGAHPQPDPGLNGGQRPQPWGEPTAAGRRPQMGAHEAGQQPTGRRASYLSRSGEVVPGVGALEQSSRSAAALPPVVQLPAVQCRIVSGKSHAQEWQPALGEGLSTAGDLQDSRVQDSRKQALPREVGAGDPRGGNPRDGGAWQALPSSPSPSDVALLETWLLDGPGQQWDDSVDGRRSQQPTVVPKQGRERNACPPGESATSRPDRVAKRPQQEGGLAFRDAETELSRLLKTRKALIWDLEESRQLFFLQSACERVVDGLIGEVERLRRQGQGLLGCNLERVVDLVMAVNHERHTEYGGINSFVSSNFATRCTQLHVYGSLESSCPGWLSKKDASATHILIHQALSYAAGNRRAGETVMSLSAGAFKGQQIKLCDLSALETSLFRSLYSACVSSMIALIRQAEEAGCWEEDTPIGRQLNDICCELACTDHLFYVSHPKYYKCSENWVVEAVPLASCKHVAMAKVAETLVETRADTARLWAIWDARCREMQPVRERIELLQREIRQTVDDLVCRAGSNSDDDYLPLLDAVAEWKHMLDQQSIINSVGISSVIFALKPLQKAAAYAASFPHLPDIGTMFGKGLLPRPSHPPHISQGSGLGAVSFL